MAVSVAGKRSTPKDDQGRKRAAIRAVKGAIYALCVTVVLVLAFALIVKQTNMDAGTISIINQVIKILSIILAAFIASRGLGKGSIMAGAVSAALYVILGYFIFSLIEGQFGDILMLFSDLVMGVIIGVVLSAILSKMQAPKAKRK